MSKPTPSRCRRWASWASWLVLAVGCGAPAAAPTSPSPAPAHAPGPGSIDALEELDGAAAPLVVAPPDDTAQRLARIERGLIPAVRVLGEPAGWSIEERLRAHHTPGISIAIIHRHRVVAAKAYGVADVSTGEPLTPTTLMPATSASKMFTAFAALKEVDAGKIPLEGNVNDTLTSWRLPDNEHTQAKPVTLKHLLTHTGGVNVPSVLQDGRTPTALELLDGKPPAITPPVRVEWAPGSAFRYSGGGTTIVEQMLIDVEERAFPQLMDDLVFRPARLDHSTFAPVKSERWPSIASIHDYDGTRVRSRIASRAGSSTGGLWTTPSDVARFLLEVQLGLEGNSSVVSPQIASRMTTREAWVDASGSQASGIGAYIESHGETVYFGHDGNGVGSRSLMRASMKGGYGAVLMANGQNAWPVMLEMLRSIAAEYEWHDWLEPPITRVEVAAPHLASRAGRYGSSATETAQIVVKDGHLEARWPFREPLELVSVSADELVGRADGSRFRFGHGERARLTLTTLPPPWPPAGPSTSSNRFEAGAPLDPLELLEAGRTTEALAEAKKRLKNDPKHPTASEPLLTELGVALLTRLDAGRAASVLQLAADLHPKSPSVRALLAEALYLAGRPKDGAVQLAQAKRIFDGDKTLSENQRTYARWRISRVNALAAPEKR